MTVRRAINILVDQGVVDRPAGPGGVRQAGGHERGHLPVEAICKNLLNAPNHTSVHMLESSIYHRRPSGWPASWPSPSVNERTIFIRRLLQASDGVPVHSTTANTLIYDPTRPVVEAELEVTALQSLFTGSSEHHPQTRRDFAIEATLLSDEEARLLEVKPSLWPPFMLRASLLRFR